MMKPSSNGLFEVLICTILEGDMVTPTRRVWCIAETCHSKKDAEHVAQNLEIAGHEWVEILYPENYIKRQNELQRRKELHRQKELTQIVPF